MMVAFAPVSIQGQRGEGVAYPNRWYVDKERFSPDDWVVVFSLPKDAEIRLVYCAGGPKEDGLFDKSGVDINHQTKTVTVRAGGFARSQSGYKGTLEGWARTLRVRYAAAFRPRG
jgi:hypothetical protein